MAKAMLLQVLMLMTRGSWAREEVPTTVIQDTRTEMSVEEINRFGNVHRDDLDYFGRPNEADSDLDFDYEDEGSRTPPGSYPPLSKEHMMKEAMLKAMKKPAIREQIGEVIPILRAMSPTQRLTLAALVSSQIMSQGRLSEANLTEMASAFAGNNVDNLEDRQNITEHLLLPISVDIAKIFTGLGKSLGRSLRTDIYDQPKARRPYRKQQTRKISLARVTPNRRMDVSVDESPPLDVMIQKRNTTKELQNLIREGVLQPSINDCEYFSSSFCLEVKDYPLDAIIKSVEKHQGIMDTLLEDFRIQLPEANGEGYPEKQRMKRRQDTGANEIRDSAQEKEFMCPSSVKYARPKRARTTSGQWKYVVNAGDYTQTLRLEMCLKPMAPCSYVTNNFHSECTQVYNYHRLLTWEENKGLHMDIFKVPSCCSCHIQGYNSFFPPNKDFPFAEKRREPISLRPSYKPEPVDVQLFANPSGKREVARNPPLLPTTTPQNFASSAGIVDKFTPLHHLVPPGPPLPLEGETILFRNDVNFHKKRGSGEHRRVAEVGPHKLEIGEVREKLATRPKYTNTVSASRVSSGAIKNRERNPGKYQGKTTEEVLFVTSKPTANKMVRHGVQKPFFEAETGKPRAVTTTTQPPTTTQHSVSSKSLDLQQGTSSSGRKKINYNYHPIIEFFIPDYTNSTSQQYAKPFSAALTADEWTPLVGRGRT